MVPDRQRVKGSHTWRWLTRVAAAILLAPQGVLAQVESSFAIEDLLNDTRRALVVLAVINPDNTADVLDIYITEVPPAGNLADPPYLLIEYFDRDGIRLGERFSWSPRIQAVQDEDGFHEEIIVEGEPGDFDVPFGSNLGSVRLTDVASGEEIASVDVRVEVALFCTANPGDPNCLDFESGDIDGDGVTDRLDNCMEHANPGQLDSDRDGFGNRCDADLNNDGLVNFADLAIFRARFGSNDPDADLNGDGVVNLADLAIFRALFGKPPGPSALVP